MVAVRHRDGWCIAKKKRDLTYADSVETLCDHFVCLPYGLSLSHKDVKCSECLARRKARSASRGEGA